MTNLTSPNVVAAGIDPTLTAWMRHFYISLPATALSQLHEYLHPEINIAAWEEHNYISLPPDARSALVDIILAHSTSGTISATVEATDSLESTLRAIIAELESAVTDLSAERRQLLSQLIELQGYTRESLMSVPQEAPVEAVPEVAVPEVVQQHMSSSNTGNRSHRGSSLPKKHR